MAAIIEETNTITAKSQTRVPKVLRPALDVACGGKIAYRIEKDRVTVHNPEAEHHEPTLAALLGLIEKNIEAGRDVRDRSGTGSFQGCRSSLALYIQGLTCWAQAISASPTRSLNFGTRLRWLGPVCSNLATAKLFASRPSLPTRIPTSILKSHASVTSSRSSPLATV
jgi:hypothetical protein